jgi:hypothetical protein
MRHLRERVNIDMNIESERKAKSGLTPWLRVCRAVVAERLFLCSCLCHVVFAPGRIAGYDQDLLVPVLACYAYYVHIRMYMDSRMFIFLLFDIVVIAVVLFLLACMHVYYAKYVWHMQMWECCCGYISYALYVLCILTFMTDQHMVFLHVLHFILYMSGGLLIFDFCYSCWNIVLVARKAIFRLVFLNILVTLPYLQETGSAKTQCLHENT